MKKEYELQNGKTVVFAYDENRIGKITVEAMDCLMDMFPKWIPCSERLPEEHENVLLCIKDWESQKTKMIVSSRRDYNYWDGLGREIRGDIAWMPLPEPYKGDEDGKC